MLRVPIAYARAGMVLSLAVFHPRRPDTVLLKEGRILDARNIERLAELRVGEVWIRYPGFEIVGEYVSPQVLESQALVTQHISRAFEAIAQGAHARLEYNEYRSAIAALLERLLSNTKAAIFIQEMADRSQPVLRHASSVCMLAVLMGLKLEDYLIVQRTRLSVHTARDVSALGVGAMLHDVGMMRLDPEVVEHWKRTQDEGDPRWQKHVWLGHELVRDAIGPAAASAVLHHHQKFDGTGFPQRQRFDGGMEAIAGQDIHIYARIVAAADLFDRLRYPPGAAPEAAPVPVVRALRQLQNQPYAAWIDPMVYRALLAVVPAYAPGSLVELSNGVQGVVTEWFPDDPCRPTVQELDPTRDFARVPPPPRRFILRETPDLQVVRAEDQDVSQDNFYPTVPGEYDLKLAGRALINAAVKPAAKAG